MAICGGITIGAAYDCTAPISPGTKSTIWVANRDDIESYTVGTNSSVITAITMKSGGAFYVFEGNRNSVTPTATFVPQTVSSGFDHMVNWNVFDISSLQKVNLEILSLSKITIIVENVNATGNGDSIFEVYGHGIGMEVETMTRINNDTETAGSFAIQTRTPDTGGKETQLPLSFFDTDYATTLAKIVLLETPAP